MQVGQKGWLKKINITGNLTCINISVEAAMEIYELSRMFPKEEIYNLTDQIHRASWPISSQIAEGWRRRKYKAAFVNKMNQAKGEAAETQVWLEYTVKCGYIW